MIVLFAAYYVVPIVLLCLGLPLMFRRTKRAGWTVLSGTLLIAYLLNRFQPGQDEFMLINMVLPVQLSILGGALIATVGFVLVLSEGASK